LTTINTDKKQQGASGFGLDKEKFILPKRHNILQFIGSASHAKVNENLLRTP
jgi:hypothetical protein